MTATLARPAGRLATATMPSPPPAIAARPDLRLEQERTLGTNRRPYGLVARCLFAVMDIVYGKRRTLAKFKVLEIIARVPYQAWEQVAYVAITHRSSKPPFARRVFERIEESRSQQDNEQWHLFILEELLWIKGHREGFLRHRCLPQVIAYVYHRISWLLYVMKPASSYALNADFEDHAEHEYAEFVRENPALEDEPYDGLFADEYGRFESLADLFRQIGVDERTHKEESLARIAEARFA